MIYFVCDVFFSNYAHMLAVFENKRVGINEDSFCFGIELPHSFHFVLSNSDKFYDKREIDGVMYSRQRCVVRVATEYEILKFITSISNIMVWGHRAFDVEPSTIHKIDNPKIYFA